MSRIVSLFVLIACLFSAACAAPATQSAAAPSRQDQPITTIGQPGSSPAQAAPASSPMPASPRLGRPLGSTPAQIDTSCRANADCVVKNVGNCCGYYPACVNINSPTDPQSVKANCTAKGMMSVCGFRDINACSCVAGKCAAGGSKGRDVLREAM